jgi:hypothetical protein
MNNWFPPHSTSSTQNSPTVERMFLKLADLAKKYFSTQLELISSSDQPAQDQDASPQFPLFKNHQPWGWIKAHGLPSPQDQARLQEMIDLLVAPAIELSEQSEDLAKLEANLTAHEAPSNVFRMDQFSRARKKIELWEPNGDDFSSVSPLGRSVFISHPDDEMRCRLAKQFHETYGGYAFLPLDTLEACFFDSQDGLSEIGGASLYISEVADLTAPIQDFIAQAAISDRLNVGPQFIVTSQYAIQAKELELLVTASLLAVLKKSARPESFLFL